MQEPRGCLENAMWRFYGEADWDGNVEEGGNLSFEI